MLSSRRFASCLGPRRAIDPIEGAHQFASPAALPIEYQMVCPSRRAVTSLSLRNRARCWDTVEFADIQQSGKFPYRALFLDQLTHDDQPMPIGERLQQSAGLILPQGACQRPLFSYLRIYQCMKMCVNVPNGNERRRIGEVGLLRPQKKIPVLIRRSAVNIDRDKCLMLSGNTCQPCADFACQPHLAAPHRLCRSQPLPSGIHWVLPGGHHLSQARHERGARVRDDSRQGLKVDLAFVRAVGLSKINAGDHLGWLPDLQR